MNHHSHSHHSHSGTSRALLIGMLLNIIFIIAEIYYGFVSDSLALLADASHNVSDVCSLFIAWGAMMLARRESNARFTYGLQSSSILAALINGVLLLIAVIAISWKAIERLYSPTEIATGTVMSVALLGVAINGLTAWLLHRDHDDLNVRAAFLHMVADTVISLAVVVAAWLVSITHWLWLDPAISLIIAIVIAYTSWGLFVQALRLSLHAVPANIAVEKVRDYLMQQEGVAEVHDLHIWAISTTNVALSAHLVMPAGHPGDAFLYETGHRLEDEFGIHHATLQIEIQGKAHPASHCCD